MLRQSSTPRAASVNRSGSNIAYLLDENVSLSQLYKQVEDSVVIIRGLLVQYDFFGRPYYSQVQARAKKQRTNGSASKAGKTSSSKHNRAVLLRIFYQEWQNFSKEEP
jgi:hypothetical protein